MHSPPWSPSTAKPANALPMVGVLVSLVLLGLVSVREHRTTQLLTETTRWVAHTHEVIGKLDETLALLNESESRRRGYALTNAPDEAKAFERVSGEIPRALSELDALVKDEPLQAERLAKLKPQISRRVEMLRVLVVAQTDRTLSAEQERQVLQESIAQMTRVRTGLGEMVAEERHLLQQRQAAADERAKVTMRESISGSLSGGALIVAAFAALWRERQRRIQSEARFHLTLESAPDAIVVANQEGRILYANRRATEVHGYDEVELLRLGIEDLIPERLRGRHATARAHYHAAPEVKAMGERDAKLLGLHKSGREFPVEVSLSPLQVGRETMAVAVIRDVTVQREFEARLRAAKDAAEAANSELESFSYTVAHDLRAPLRAIDHFALATIEDFGEQLPAEGVENLDRVRKGVRRMAQLIDDLLALARVSQGEMRLTHVDLSALANEVLGRLKQHEPGRKVRCVIQPGLSAQADPRLMRVAMENLLGNAWKFTSKRAEPTIEFGGEGARRTFFVRDDGAGFDMQHVSKLFGPFQRLHRAEEFEGTGIGLATVHRIVRRHGGKIWTEAAPDRGATFYFTLGGES